jgi:hypothetical protein
MESLSTKQMCASTAPKTSNHASVEGQKGAIYKASGVWEDVRVLAKDEER